MIIELLLLKAYISNTHAQVNEVRDYECNQSAFLYELACERVCAVMTEMLLLPSDIWTQMESKI